MKGQNQGPLVGCHNSAAGGVHNALKEARSLSATASQLFTSNQKQWKGKPISAEEVQRWEKARADSDVRAIISHDGYLINLGSHVPDLLHKSREAFIEEIHRCQLLDIDFLNFHPGTATDKNPERCLDTIVESLLSFAPLLDKKSKLKLVLETTAGQGNTVGAKFEDIAYIMQQCHKKIPLGVCIDTCHIFAAGYDIRTPDAFDNTLKEFDRVIGLEHLYCFHINDSKKGLGTRVDRHASLGFGEIGMEAFKFVMQDDRTRHLPMCLETPQEEARWEEEIQMLKDFYHKKN
ncbi:MAG: deoxyribonuclease IV [Chlamydiia bacterium]